MNTNRDIVRMRHVLKHEPTKWDAKKGFDALAGAVLVGGLVQALLLSIKGRSGDTGVSMKRAAETLLDWLKSTDAGCPIPNVPNGISGGTLERYAASLIALPGVSDALIIQSEALRYLSQAKLVAGAFKAQPGG
jgi:hypothetical protein